MVHAHLRGRAEQRQHEQMVETRPRLKTGLDAQVAKTGMGGPREAST